LTWLEWLLMNIVLDRIEQVLPVFALTHACFIRGDLQKPCFETVVIPKLPNMCDRFQNTFLDNLFHVLFVLQNGIGDKPQHMEIRA